MSLRAGRCHIRSVQDRDYARLEEIYRGHEASSLPKGYFEMFQDTIRDDQVLYLVAEVNGKVIGGGGISGYAVATQASLTFGIVDIDECRKGYGTALMLTRLLLVCPRSEGRQIVLQATEWSAPFFGRLTIGRS